MIQFGVLLVTDLEKDNSLSCSLPLPLLVADRRSGYVCVLAWFHLGILILILISILCGIPDRLSSDFFWHIHDEGMWELGDGVLPSCG
jgi:hypothetical protein